MVPCFSQPSMPLRFNSRHRAATQQPPRGRGRRLLCIVLIPLPTPLMTISQIRSSRCGQKTSSPPASRCKIRQDPLVVCLFSKFKVQTSPSCHPVVVFENSTRIANQMEPIFESLRGTPLHFRVTTHPTAPATSRHSQCPRGTKVKKTIPKQPLQQSQSQRH